MYLCKRKVGFGGGLLDVEMGLRVWAIRRSGWCAVDYYSTSDLGKYIDEFTGKRGMSMITGESWVAGRIEKINSSAGLDGKCPQFCLHTS